MIQSRPATRLIFSSRMLHASRQQEPEVGVISIYATSIIPLGSNSISKQLAAYWRSIQGYIQESCVVFLQSPFSKDSLHRLSIVLLMFERAMRSLYIVATAAAPANTMHSQERLLPNVLGSLSEYVNPGDQMALIMVASLAFLFETTNNATSNFLALPAHSARQEIMILMTILFSLVCLESFLPLALWCFLSLLLFRTICWETTLSIMVTIWLGSVIGSHMPMGGMDEVIGENMIYALRSL